MQGALLPLFPLEVVLFPGTPLPLHIFEDRYKEMIAEAIASQTEFGVVLARERGILNVGCTAKVDSVLQRYDDGRLDIMTVGQRRFEILSLDQEKAYLRGEVRLFDDDEFPEVPLAIRKEAIDGWAKLRELTGEDESNPNIDDPHLSFQLAQAIPDLDFRQILLRSRSELERMKLLVDQIPAIVKKIRYTTHVRRVAPRNGHAQGSHVE